MLAFFRNNLSTTVFLLALYTVALHLPAMLGWVQMPARSEELTSLLFRDLFGWAAKEQSRSAVTATVLVFFQALLVHYLADHFRMLNDRSWYPGVFYALAASCLPEFQFVSPTLVAASFIPLALWRIFSVYKQTFAFSAIFDGALWVTLAALFYPPAVWVLPAAYLALLNLRAFSFREQVVFLTGSFTPFFLGLSWYFWFDQAGTYLLIQFTHFFSWPTFTSPDELLNGLKITFLGLLLLSTMFSFNIYYYKRLIQVQKYVTILYWFLFAGLAATLFQHTFRPEFILLAVPSIGIFLSYLFESIRNQALSEILHLGLLAATYSLQFYP
ncbi:MAG: hypothetical protein JNK89_05375 [Saprospiraceae bacterium]|nr:hypothetical protein [Saprospiraceae bacterium]